MLSLLQVSNIGLRFFLELSALAAYGYWGFQRGGSTPLRWLLGLGAISVVALLWGRWAAPASAHRLTGPGYYLFQLLIFGGATLALYASGRATLALLFGIVVLNNIILLIYWNQ